MTSELPQAAFSFYVALGERRAHRTVAEQLGVPLALIERVAATERWQRRVAAIEDYARRFANGERGIPKTYSPDLDWIDDLRVAALAWLRNHPVLTALEAIDQREAQMQVARERGGSNLSQREIWDYCDEMRGLVLADRQALGTPELGEKGLL